VLQDNEFESSVFLNMQVGQRRRIVQQFNADKRIGCLLMLSRMPVLGLDLPEADVVVFYDFDLRGDMHEHAEVFCHRMALVRDLEIVRFVPRCKIFEILDLSSLTCHESCGCIYIMLLVVLVVFC